MLVTQLEPLRTFKFPKDGVIGAGETVQITRNEEGLYSYTLSSWPKPLPTPGQEADPFYGQFDAIEAAWADWLDIYPSVGDSLAVDICKRCDGKGLIEGPPYDPSPPGVALSPGYMVDIDICPNCLDRDICPLCGEKEVFWDAERYICPSCGHQGDA